MNRIFCFLLIITMFCIPMCPCAAVAGTIYYIDAVNGNDSNNGTSEASPWKTLSAAAERTYIPGDRILLKAGSIFNECFTAHGGGTAAVPVVLGTYGDTKLYGKPIVISNEDEAVLVTLHNVTGWTVENIEFSAPNGSGIYITSDFHGVTSDIIVKDCSFHEIWNKQCSNHNGGHCPILISSTGQYARIRGITVQDCEIYDCAFGIKTKGLNREMNPDHFVSPEVSYNADFLFEGISFNRVYYDAVIICAVNGLLIRNCALINTSVCDDFYCAPMWSHHACNYTIENCEIAGATNEKDGMAIDFDGWTTDAVCQYIYSHDNVRFINSCCYDNYTKNANCTVRYCLSVNDNKATNNMANLLTVKAVDYAEDEYAVSMDSFKFYNNTLINCSDISCGALSNSIIANNIFVGKDALSSVQDKRKNSGENGSFVTSFSGIFTNNCFWNMGLPNAAVKSFIDDPCFAGREETDKNSYMLAKSSVLIGNGIQVEADMGKRDFYGNALTDSHNIGCYEGSGEDVPQTENSCIHAHHTKVVFTLNTLLATQFGRLKSISSSSRFFLW